MHKLFMHKKRSAYALQWNVSEDKIRCYCWPLLLFVLWKYERANSCHSLTALEPHRISITVKPELVFTSLSSSLIGAFERFRNALSSARIRSGLDMCETSEGIAKGTHNLLPSRSRVSMCPWNERRHDPVLGVGHCRASTYKKKLSLLRRSSKMVRACLGPML